MTFMDPAELLHCAIIIYPTVAALAAVRALVSVSELAGLRGQGPNSARGAQPTHATRPGGTAATRLPGLGALVVAAWAHTSVWLAAVHAPACYVFGGQLLVSASWWRVFSAALAAAAIASAAMAHSHASVGLDSTPEVLALPLCVANAAGLAFATTTTTTLIVVLELWAAVTTWALVAYSLPNADDAGHTALVTYVWVSAASTLMLVAGVAAVAGSGAQAGLGWPLVARAAGGGGSAGGPRPAQVGWVLVCLAAAAKAGLPPLAFWVPQFYQGATRQALAFYLLAHYAPYLLACAGVLGALLPPLGAGAVLAVAAPLAVAVWTSPRATRDLRGLLTLSTLVNLVVVGSLLAAQPALASHAWGDSVSSGLFGRVLRNPGRGRGSVGGVGRAGPWGHHPG